MTRLNVQFNERQEKTLAELAAEIDGELGDAEPLILTVLTTGLGFATLGLGLIVVLPLLGYATYEGYLETIDASEWPAT